MECDDSLHCERFLCCIQQYLLHAQVQVLKLKAAHDELFEQIEAVRRENGHLAHEIKDLTDQLGEGGRSAHELQKMVRRLEVEKEELQVSW